MYHLLNTPLENNTMSACLYAYGISILRFLHVNIAVAVFMLGSCFISTSSTLIAAPKSGVSAASGIPTQSCPGSQLVATMTALSTIGPKYSALPVTALG